MQRRSLHRHRLVVLALPMLVGCGYNRIQTLDEQAANQHSQIEVQLQRRADLIPNLVNTVQGFAQQELAVLTNVTRARAGLVEAIQSGDPERQANADADLNAQLAIVNRSVVENYPQLTSNANFIALQDELTGTENRIAVARRDYNESVRSYNSYIRTFPAVITAKVTGAQARKYFEVTSGAAREVPTVEFPAPGGAPPAPSGGGTP
ncbi:MAG TPA: LemA family protein [Gemmatimonadaceae bacterium]